MYTLLEEAQKIKCLICDVDGVLTDGKVFLDNQGNELKAFHIQDGFGLKLLMAAGLEVAVITGSKNAMIDQRMQQLGIRHYFTGQLNKQNAYDTLKNTLQLPDESFAYIGDDLPDLPIMQQVGFGVAVANAVRQVKEFAAWQTELCGGEGAVREVCDLILSAQNLHEAAVKRYLNL